MAGSAVRVGFVWTLVGGVGSSGSGSSDGAKDSMEIMLGPSIQEIRLAESRLAERPDKRLAMLIVLRQDK